MTTPEETYRRGSVVLRGDQIPRLTADASLLQTEHSADWKHTDPWRVLRIQSEFVEGFEALAKVGPAISVFGSARTQSRRTLVPVCSADRRTPGSARLRGHYGRWPGRDGGREPWRVGGRRYLRGPGH